MICDRGREKMLQPTRLKIVAVLAAIGVVGAACAELPDIAQNQCGNRIIDPGEDCDTFATSGSSCRPAGSDGACHFDCTGTNVCPPTYTCAPVDKICRQPTGTYDVANVQTLFALTTSLTLADFDGDGRADALTSGANDVRIHFFDGRLSLSKTLILPIDNPRYHIGEVGNDTAADFVIFRTTGFVDVFRGQSDRTLAPVVYSSIPIPNTNISGRLFPVRNQIGNVTGDSAQKPTGDDLLAFGSDDKGNPGVLDLVGRDTSADADAGTSAANISVAVPDSTVDKLAGAVAVGSYIEGSVCDQFAIGFMGDSKVDLYTPCRPLPAAPPEPPSKTYELNAAINALGAPDLKYVQPTHIVMPPGATFGASQDSSFGTATAGAFSFDVNADGHVDLVIAGMVGSAAQILVAYGIGDGTFSSSPTLAPVDDLASIYGGTQLATLLTNITGQKNSVLPLAVADLNHDKALDFVFPGVIAFSEIIAVGDGGTTATRYVLGPSAPNGATWTSATIADVNHDGLPDVAATNPTGSIDFFLGTGTEAMSYLSYGLDGVPANLVAGDFDGDLVNDLAFSVSGVASGDGGTSLDEIEVLFGQGQSFPAQPVSLGSSPSTVAMVAGPLATQYTGATAPTDVNISSIVALTGDSQSNEYGAILLGNTDRIITSAFSLTPPTGPRGFVVRGSVGPMQTAKQDDMLLMARDSQSSVGLPNYSFWYAPSTGEATLSSENLTQGPTLPATFGWEQSTLVTPGFNAMGIEDTIVIALPLLKTKGQPQLFVIDSKALTLGAPIPIPCTYDNEIGTPEIQMRFVDFDADGNRDGLLLCPDISGKPVVAMYWGDGTGAISAPGMIVPLPSDPVTGITFERKGPTLSHAVVLLTAKGLFTTTPGGTDGRTFGPLVQEPTLPGGSDIGEADIDGDGVADFGIVDATKTQVQFFRGIPVNDSASVP